MQFGLWGSRPVSADGFSLRTPRLLLREFREIDAEPLFRLNSDPDVMRYTGDAPFAEPAAALDFIRHYDHYQRHGFGRWAVTSRESGDFMGFCGLRRHPEYGDIDLAFRLFRCHWDSGYATEAAHASLAAGFDRFGLQEITGWAMRENRPSITVLGKLGMRFREMAEDSGVCWLVYAISADAFGAGDTS